MCAFEACLALMFSNLRKKSPIYNFFRMFLYKLVFIDKHIERANCFMSCYNLSIYEQQCYNKTIYHNTIVCLNQATRR